MCSFTLRYNRSGCGLFALVLRDHGQGGVDRSACLSFLCLSLFQLRTKNIRIHPGNDLPNGNRISFLCIDIADATRRLGCNVEFYGLDAPVSARKGIAQSFGMKITPDKKCRDCRNEDQ